jgi:hypothetical protein
MNARLVDSTLSPMQRLLLAHEQATGHRERRSGNSTRITCAACATNTYKVAVTEASNGSVLLHAFCGHTPHEVLGAMGLQIGDLFQRRDLRTMSPAERHQLRQASLASRTQAAVTVLGHEAHVMLEAANKLGDGYPLTEDEQTRMRVAALKVWDCIEVFSYAR